MLFKSGIVTQGSGSFGGLTMARNRSGMYFRARALPVDPGSTAQQDIRAEMQAASIAWFTVLTEQQRIDWETYAANVTVLNRLGDPIYLTGMQMYVRSRVPTAYYSGTVVADAPTIFNLATFVPVTVSASEATNLISVTFDNTDAWANEANGHMLVAASIPKNASVNYFKGPFLRRGTIDGATPTPPTSPQTFTAPATYTADQRFFVHVRSLRADGRLSTPQIATGLVLA